MATFTPRPAADVALDLSTAIQPSACGRHFVRHVAPDAPFFYLGDTAWELFHRLDEGEAERYLRNRQAKGFNVIMVVLLAEHGGLDFPNRAGAWPFFPSANSTDSKYEPDLLRPNPVYFAFVDRVVRLASTLGMTIALTPTWGRYVNGGYYGGPILFDTDSAYAYARFVGERYPFHPFILGADSVRYWNADAMAVISSGGDAAGIEVKDFGDVTEAFARGLRDGEKAAIEGLEGGVKNKAQGYETMITFHSAQMWLPGQPEASASAQFPDADWLAFDCVQSGHHDVKPPSNGVDEADDAGSTGTDVQAGKGSVNMWKCRNSYEPVRKMYATPRPDGKPRPVLDLEPHYENIHEWFNLNGPKWQGRDIRSGLWQGVCAGAAGYTYGVNSIWQMHNGSSKTYPPIAPPTTAYTDWFLELDLPGSFYASVAQRILVGLPEYFSRVPDQSLILSSTNEPEPPALAGDKLISACRGKGWAIVHLPYGGDVEVDLKGVKGSHGWRAWWIEPKSGGREIFATGDDDKRAFAAPSGGSLDDDWLLLVEAVVV
ncbi:hypothetical protein Q5752_007094 [Cryptotrichosporon argae]